MSKQEKRGKTWVILLLTVPLVLSGMSFLWGIYAKVYQAYEASFFLLIGIGFAMIGLISFAIYLGKKWSLVLMIILSLIAMFASIWNHQFLYAKQGLSFWQIAELLFSISFYALPPFLLFLPAPNAFLRYQREKNTRHLSVLEHQLNQIGKEES